MAFHHRNSHDYVDALIHYNKTQSRFTHRGDKLPP